MASFQRKTFLPTPLVPVAGFAAIIFLGSLMLRMLSTSTGAHIPWIDALFMATSATCVTGLSLYDIGTQFSPWAQGTLLLLIQVGGLGIMLLSTVLLMAVGQGISFASRFLIQDTYTYGPRAHLRTFVVRVMLFTLVIETAGAALLVAAFVDRMPWSQAVFHAIFHSVSAFCNAGFSLFSDSLVGYRDSVLVTLVMAALIVLGGLGFLVLHETFRAPRQKRPWPRLSLHSKLALTTTIFLIGAGTVFFLCCEWNTTLARQPLSTKILASFFQSITVRTAGFNSLDFSQMKDLTLLGTILLMFVGASPGSTGGGIKTTTVAVLVALSRARFRGSPCVHAFRRTISDETQRRAFSVFVLSATVVVIGTAFLVGSELSPLPLAESRARFMEILFETTSAFGTVGLSLGATARLSFWGKVTVIALMFIGRLGPLVLAMAIQPRKDSGHYEYAEEPVMIG
ncbi:TrkH family potassium uptake protein [Desulfosoma caldarium]|uniref:Trk system potassium uptake protein TrkH n=1 Tax=Desulfosoma caldarium TaxID=610254 RepID=A0A3N1VSM0_9BACT|nr:TrkH family potassium uptake protein [Desulfosoma caldarium]ROR03212.1 trk system potassium uptake protein TrkH [Desulfosoma caldarium]